MMQIDELVRIMEDIADPGLAAEWDNPGIQVNVGRSVISKALIALEISCKVIEEAKEKEADIIITHHPLIFTALHSIDHNTVTGNYIVELINSKISVYSAHTNFDEAEGGNNDYLAALLKLENVRKPENWTTGRRGELSAEMNFKDICAFIKESLKLEHVNVVGGPRKMIKKIGICAGAGAGIIGAAIASGCELFVTGDIKYHDARYAAEKGMCLLDAGHYGTEKFFVKNLHGKLTAAVSGKLEIIASAVNIDPFTEQ